MHIVGLTGGIGSGKSALADRFRRLGVPVVDADVIARRCVAQGSSGLGAVVERFGSEVLGPDGSLDRAALAAIVFADPGALRDLETITHPCIRRGIAEELAALRSLPEPPTVVVVEHPLLIETGSHRDVDTVISVEAPIPLRLERLSNGRGMSEVAARSRIAAQLDDAQRRAVAHLVIVNDGDLAALDAKAPMLLERVRERAGAR